MLACIVIVALLGLQPLVGAEPERDRDSPRQAQPQQSSPDLEALKRETLQLVAEMHRFSVTLRAQAEAQSVKRSIVMPPIIVKPPAPAVVIVPMAAPTAMPDTNPKHGGLLAPLFR